MDGRMSVVVQEWWDSNVYAGSVLYKKEILQSSGSKTLILRAESKPAQADHSGDHGRLAA